MADFRTARLAEGFDEVAERVGDRTQHLVAGDEFHLARDQAHAERYGAPGAAYLAARKR